MSSNQNLRLGGRPQEVNLYVVDFVRLGFGGSHRIPVRSLEFEIEIPNRATLEAALINGIVGYNRMSGTTVAKHIAPLWDDLSSVMLGRWSDPIMRIHLPYTQQQRNGGDNGRAIPLSAEERNELIGRIRVAARACEATVLFRTVKRRVELWRPKQPLVPSQIRLLWQD